jgi:hypothetical protein
VKRSTALGNGLPPPTREERVQLCMRLIRRMKWRKGITDHNIARHWGVSVSLIHSYSAEAFRRVRAEVTDPDSTGATVGVALDRVIREASTKGLAGHRSIIEASKAWAAISGATAPTRIEVGALATMTEDQLQRRRDEIVRRLQEDDRLSAAPDNDDLEATVKARAELAERVEAEVLADRQTEGGAAADQNALRASMPPDEEDEALIRHRIVSRLHGRPPKY